MTTKLNFIRQGLIMGLLLVMSLSARATLIDFDALADGNYNTVGNTSFSLVGNGIAGDPFKMSFFDGNSYLFNSSAPFLFPTNSILRVDFGSLVNNLMFDFNGFGEGNMMSWRIFDASFNELALDNSLDANLASYDLSAYSGISRIEFSSGNDQVNRFFGLQRISFDSQTTSVPEPSTTLLILVAVAGIFYTRSKRLSI